MDLDRFAPVRGVWLLAGLVLGIPLGAGLGGYWPYAPLHAVATDSSDNFAIATGPLDERMEGIFCLDQLTGDLRGAAINFRTGRFTAFFEGNVLAALNATDIKNPQFLMVTGHADFLRPGGNVRQANTVIYVMETTGGWLAAYAVPWNPSSQALAANFAANFVLLDRRQVRNVEIRDQ
jgi:hypothetical protein